MASRLINAITKKREIHAVGNLNSGRVDTIAHGAKAKVNIENYSLVTLGFNAEGEREFDYVTADTVADVTYLVAGSEEMFEIGGYRDSYADYYIGKGEKARVVVLRKGLRYETNNFELKATETPAKNGHFVEWDATKKKYAITDTATENFAGVKLVVVDVNGSTLDGQKCIRFEVQ